MRWPPCSPRLSPVVFQQRTSRSRGESGQPAGAAGWRPQGRADLDRRGCRWFQRLQDPSLQGGLAKLAKETGLEITVCHYPPGTSKWNKIVIYTGFPGVYEVTNEPAPDLVALVRQLSASRH